MTETLRWENCYNTTWSGLITADSFKHPAKFSHDLIHRIYRHMIMRGWLHRGDRVGDPFGGVACGGVVAGYHGLLWIGMELEPRFVEWGKQNLAMHKANWCQCLLGDAVLIHGDSRYFHKLFVEAIVTSPPYADSVNAQKHGIDWSKVDRTNPNTGNRKRGADTKHGQTLTDQLSYGKTEGQIGALKSGEVDAVVTSPAYAQSLRGLGHNGIDVSKMKASGNHTGKSSIVECQEHYGEAEGQIAALAEGKLDAVISSPPFAGTSGTGGGGINKKGYVPADGRKWTGKKSDPVGARSYQGQGGDRAEGNIEILKPGTVDAVVTSSPYGDTLKHGGGPDTKQDLLKGGKSLQGIKDGYGNTDGQIDTLKRGSIDAVVTSAPYADIAAGAGGLNTKPAKKPGQQSGRSASSASQNADQRYGAADGQIAKLAKGTVENFLTPDQKQTYWSEMAKIYHSCFLSLKPGGVLCVVLKDYVKDKKRVPLCNDSCRLLEFIGFTIVERAHAMLVKETKHGDLFEGETTTTKSKKSFFRRLAEAKGSPKIDFEEVVFCQKPM